ncbi:MAG TPA: hypothetical protein VI979_00825, partial [archaeon]|nr:hypothetical protein [archaeon]
MYDRFNDEGKMRVKWSALVRMIENGEFDEQQKTIDEFYALMVSRRFMPNTPAIANFGTTLGMGSACFHPSQLISTMDGTKAISEVQVGDEVLTHKGRFRKVKEVFVRETDSLLSFACRKLPRSTMMATDEHPILAFKDGEVGWYPAYMLKKGDKAALSYPVETKDVEKIRVSEIVSGVTLKDGKCYYEYAGGKHNAFVHATKPVTDAIDVDHDLMKLFGFYLSEGNVSENECVRFTLSADEEGYCREIISITERKFGITARIESTNNPERKWLSLRFHSTILAKFFAGVFGTGFDRKRIPAWIMALPAEKQKGLMSGMIRGDGTVFKNWNKMNARLVMSNINLVYAFWQMAMRCGVFAALGKESMPKLGTVQPTRCTLGNAGGQLLMNELYGRTIQETVGEDNTTIINGIVFTEIENIEKVDYRGPVYNLEVEEDHSYVANMVSVHNCFVLGVGDSMESIMETLKSTALIHKAGGGTGFNFSSLRPEGDYVSSTSGVASGPLSFMKLFDTMTEVVKQGGIRRGANMGILNINHPDIEKFIKAKEGNKALRNFNISVLIMPDFWEYYQNGTPYPLRNPRSGKITGYADPKLLFDLIVYQAWESAEPGVIFYDYVNKYNPFLKYLGPIVTTNPCVTGDTLVSIKTGTISIKELAEMYPNGGIPITVERTIQSGNQLLRALEYTSEFKAFKTGKKQITKLTTENGRELRCTADHRILTSEGWKEASSLTKHDKIFVEGGTDRLQKTEPEGIEDVYDITEPATHSFIANGIVVHNCGEVLLYPNESCNLGSMNVWSYVMEGANGAYVDWEALKQGVLTASHLLDNVIDVNNYPLKAIEEMTLATRKIGLGVMGLADLLFELRLPYNSAEGRAMMEQVMEFINYHSKAESIRLAKERGPVPFFGKSFYPEGRLPISGAEDRESWHFDWSALAEQIKQHGIRNGYTTVVAPTGSISMIAGCSSGMEPVYALVWEKHVAVGSFYYTEPVFEKIMKKEGLFDDDLVKDVCDAGGTLQTVGYVPPQIKNFLKVARDITPEDHIRALAAIQKWTDSSVSKTNNFPADATVDDMRQSYLLSYQLGCKDVTVFRDTSIKNQVLRVGAKTRLQQPVQPVQQVIAKDATGRSVLMSAPDVRSDNEISSNYCPKCSMKLVKQEGCMMCMDCGWGKCA